VARDRKRAKQRQARRARDGAQIAPSGLPVRADLPGALDHAGGEVDEFDAALIRGAEGTPVEEEPEVATNGSEPPEADAEVPAGESPDAGAEGSTATEALPPESTEAGEAERAAQPDGQQLPARVAGTPYAGAAKAVEDEPDEEDEYEEEKERPRPAVRRTHAAPAERRGGIHRAIGFLRASWAELHRVQWPDRHQVTQATAVVLGFVAVAGVYLGLADLVAKSVVEAIL
jgi:preprotein translocase subunit SecE